MHPKFVDGFKQKCAEFGLDPEAVVTLAENVKANISEARHEKLASVMSHLAVPILVGMREKRGQVSVPGVNTVRSLAELPQEQELKPAMGPIWPTLNRAVSAAGGIVPRPKTEMDYSKMKFTGMDKAKDKPGYTSQTAKDLWSSPVKDETTSELTGGFGPAEPHETRTLTSPSKNELAPLGSPERTAQLQMMGGANPNAPGTMNLPTSVAEEEKTPTTRLTPGESIARDTRLETRRQQEIQGEGNRLAHENALKGEAAKKQRAAELANKQPETKAPDTKPVIAGGAPARGTGVYQGGIEIPRAANGGLDYKAHEQLLGEKMKADPAFAKEYQANIASANAQTVANYKNYRPDNPRETRYTSGGKPYQEITRFANPEYASYQAARRPSAVTPQAAPAAAPETQIVAAKTPAEQKPTSTPPAAGATPAATPAATPSTQVAAATPVVPGANILKKPV